MLDPDAPPNGLTARQAAAWRRLLTKAPHGVLREGDEALAVLLVRMLDVNDAMAARVALEGPTYIGADGAEAPAPWWRIMRDTTTAAGRLLTACGLTPQSRLRVLEGAPEQPAAPDPDDPWQTFEIGMRQADARLKAEKTKPKRPRH
jgi:P27 family predicted phage terminase small subunit